MVDTAPTPHETLIPDARAGMRPREFVDRKLVRMLGYPPEWWHRKPDRGGR
jgi:hypothetical protein